MGIKPNSQKDPLGLTLPNVGSKLQTPTTLMIDLRNMELWHRMGWERFSKLCNFLNVTAAELASMVGLRHGELEGFERKNRLWQGGSRNLSAAVLLTTIEASACKGYTQDIIPVLYPDLTKAGCA